MSKNETVYDTVPYKAKPSTVVLPLTTEGVRQIGNVSRPARVRDRKCGRSTEGDVSFTNPKSKRFS